MVSATTNKAIVRRYLEQVLNERRTDLFAEFLIDSYQIHGANIAPGWEAAQEWHAMIGAAFPDLRLTIEDIIAERDRVVVRGMLNGTHQGELCGIPATGRKISHMSITIYRLVKGQIVESWNVANNLDLTQKLDALPQPKASVLDPITYGL
jgi:predicted ester cyclase